MLFCVKVLICLGLSWQEGPCPCGAQVCAGPGRAVSSRLLGSDSLVPFPHWAGLALLASLGALDAPGLAAAGDGAFPEGVFALGGETLQFKGARPPAVEAGPANAFRRICDGAGWRQVFST